MNVEYINPFLSSTIDIFSEMFGVTPVPSSVYIDERAHSHRWDISSVMVLTGNAIGVVVIRLTRILADSLLRKTGVAWNAEEEREELINGMVGELVNIVAARASGKLVGYKIDISVPIVVQGQNHTISWPDKEPILAVPFSTPMGHFLVNVSLTELPAAYRR